MKLIGLIFLSIFLAKGCNEDAEIEKASISYEASTRGFYRIIKIDDKKLFVASTRGEKPEEVKISKKDWASLVDAFKEINLEELPNYKAPSQKRMVDAAPHANFKIMRDGKIYESQVFDHGNPPIEIEGFINKLIALTLKENDDD
ncbi:MAG: hypothetical protein ACK4RM_08040 [Flavobacterium sp.]